ncbi:MAG: DUF1592 domain-containing protein [Myxococcota bacterium]
MAIDRPGRCASVLFDGPHRAPYPEAMRMPSRGQWSTPVLVFLLGCYQGLNEPEAELGPQAPAGSDSGIDDAGEPEPEPSACGGELVVGPAPLRRLTATQYDHTIRDLLGIETTLADSFADDERIGPFRSNGTTPVATLQVEQYQVAAEAIAAEAVEDLGPLVACDPTVSGPTECGRTFIESMGRRAYRRPLTPQEHEILESVFTAGLDAGGFSEGIQSVLETMLQSPAFLYHLELGDPEHPTGRDDIVALTAYEIASRLSYLVWNSMPDDALLDAAAAGQLGDPEQIDAQLDRMWADPRAGDALADFHLQWMAADELDELQKDPEHYPDFNAELAAALEDEIRGFVSWTFEHGDGDLSTLLTAAITPSRDPQVLALYGLDPSEGQGVGEPTPLDPERRAGLLTLPGVLAQHAHANQSSPVHRGVMVRQNLLCQSLAPPPEDVDNVPSDPSPDATTRDRLEEHTQNPECRACHELIDPIGFGFEHYDALGAYREQDAGRPIDASGELVATDGLDGPFIGAVELSHRLAESNEVQQCVTQQWFRYALGRLEVDDDDCTLTLAHQAFETSGGDVRALVRALVRSDSFRFIRR